MGRRRTHSNSLGSAAEACDVKVGSHTITPNGRRRHRVSSATLGGGRSENSNNMAADNALLIEARDATSRIIESWLRYRDGIGETLFHKTRSMSTTSFSNENFALINAFLTRLQQLVQQERTIMLDETSAAKERKYSTGNTNDRSSKDLGACGRLFQAWMLVPDLDSGYTPLHAAVYRAELPTILLLLRHCLVAEVLLEQSEEAVSISLVSGHMMYYRFRESPMELLSGGVRGPDDFIGRILLARDNEGLTPSELLMASQRRELLACRVTAIYRPRVISSAFSHTNSRNGDRLSSIDLDNDIEAEAGNERNEFDLMSRSLMWLQRQNQRLHHETMSPAVHARNQLEHQDRGDGVNYGCEVLSFGSAHHCALGVGQDQGNHEAHVARPRRVREFSCRRKSLGATAIAAAAHHSLVVTRSGHLFSFGLGKGGRLGTGSEAHCPLPTRVLGALSSRQVVSVAAAENHSLCVTSCGSVYAFGSNRFGQLGISTSDDDVHNNARCLPRRVDDLKNVFCVSVAAGLKHSVALSRFGEIYVWGDNSSGQLGTITRRSGAHKVQRVEALWGNLRAPRIAISIAASDYSTLALTLPTGRGSLPVNTIFSWGHGNSSPSKVHFERPQNDSKKRTTGRPVNPVAIACARHHNVAVSSDGRVYTWGIHAETLGTTRKSKLDFSPQLVTGMDGVFAVGVSASENHTAVITDSGALFTWGATNGKNVLGHEGVRWQPDPKRVPGVYRAVGVAVAKEHTILLIGTSFPAPPVVESSASLASLASRELAEYVDLFNCMPSLIVAERTNSPELIAYCTEFVRRNLDGVLALGRKAEMDCYLEEQLMTYPLLCSDDTDRRYHRDVVEVVVAGMNGPMTLGESPVSDVSDWLIACRSLLDSRGVLHADTSLFSSTLVGPVEHSCVGTSSPPYSHADYDRTWKSETNRPRSASFCSARCVELTQDMDTSSIEKADAARNDLIKEIRSARKRLSQIAKLEGSCEKPLSSDEQRKIDRRPQLEADLRLYEPALLRLQKKIEKMAISQSPQTSEPKYQSTDESVKGSITPERTCFRCKMCNISCPDQRSLSLHLNGRKHRNRAAQVEDEEKEGIAASLLEGRRRKEFLSTQTGGKPHIPSSSCADSSPWKGGGKACVKGMPQYKLPAPPVPISDSLASSGVAVSFADIMREEENKRRSYTVTNPILPSKPASLRLPKGAAGPISSPPWASAPVISTEMPPVGVPHRILGDFMSQGSPASKTARKGGQTWATAPGVTKTSKPLDQRGRSFEDIQREQEQQKMASRKGVENGKWFVQQRERAGSLKDIQSSAEKEREERMFIEEQFRIEKMIKEEMTASAGSTRRKAREKNRHASTKSRAANGSRRNGKPGGAPGRPS